MPLKYYTSTKVAAPNRNWLLGILYLWWCKTIPKWMIIGKCNFYRVLPGLSIPITFFPTSPTSLSPDCPSAALRVWRYVQPKGKNKEILASPEVMTMWKSPEGSGWAGLQYKIQTVLNSPWSHQINHHPSWLTSIWLCQGPFGIPIL